MKPKRKATANWSIFWKNNQNRIKVVVKSVDSHTIMKAQDYAVLALQAKQRQSGKVNTWVRKGEL